MDIIKSNCWIFQYTTRIYKNVLLDFKNNKINVWEVTKHINNIKNGDIAIIYIGGHGAKAIYGLMNIISDVFFDEKKMKYYVRVSTMENWSNIPILYSQAKLLIPEMFLGIMGTNFRSNHNQLSILKNYVLNSSLQKDS